MCEMRYKIKFVWDNDAAVWIATSDDVPGLVLESDSFDALVERVRYAVPELIELNGASSVEKRAMRGSEEKYLKVLKKAPHVQPDKALKHSDYTDLEKAVDEELDKILPKRVDFEGRRD